MAFLLRQIVAGPRSRHPEADLDLCYVTPQIIATSGPSGSYPKRAYRNPLNQFVKFLDQNHGSDWAIWEFRAEGAGYPDEEVYGRVWHYPWPDHHPPPFRLVPIILEGMRNWLQEKSDGNKDKKRVVVVHCKAGKGRSGTMACSYLISECGWKQEEALARFTERRMRPGFGQGVSIPSQLRWVGYVDRWAQNKKIYTDWQVEILEIHAWGLRNGIRLRVEGYVDEGKTIKTFHHFSKRERILVEGKTTGEKNIESRIQNSKSEDEGKENFSKSTRMSELNTKVSNSAETESSGSSVIFRPLSRIILPTSDVNIDFERRSKANMVTSVAHFWFNCFFEGQGPEKGGQPNEDGVFEIYWEKMDGIKGSSKKGTKALDRLAVVWKIYHPHPEISFKAEEEISRPGPECSVSKLPTAESPDCKISRANNQKESGLNHENLGLNPLN